ncbi:MAG: hypothetical protein AAF587_12845 [Bacteroidota bacterium]
MKKRIVIFPLFLFMLGLSYGQTPQAFSYQAVARDANGDCLGDATISVRFSIRDSSSTGPILYQEQHIAIQTNAQGLFSLPIGADTTLATGAGQISDFANLYWTNQLRWLQVDIDPAGGATFVMVGSQQLLTVPYAMSAGNGLQLSTINQDEFMRWHDPDGKRNGVIGGNGSGLTNGYLGLYNSTEETKAELYSGKAGTDEYGVFALYGSNGTLNHAMSVFSSNGRSRGAQSWRDDQGVTQVAVYINTNNEGIIEADIKNFVMDHPLDPAKEIAYASLEGPEAAAYERGTALLTNGEARIEFSEHFGLIANPETMTIILTPRSAESMGLAAMEYTSTGFKVKELQQAKGNYEFDWEAKAVRNGFEDYQVIRNKRKDDLADIRKR